MTASIRAGMAPALAGILFVVALLITPTPPPASAAPLDGSGPIICAGAEVRECEAGGMCLPLRPEHVNLPAMIEIDAKQKMLTGLGGKDKRTAPIQAVEQRDGRLIMYGGQEGRGWTLGLTEATGRLTPAVVNAGFSFVPFGPCAAP